MIPLFFSKAVSTKKMKYKSIAAGILIILSMMHKVSAQKSLTDSIHIIKGVEVNSWKDPQNATGIRILIPDSMLIKAYDGMSISEFLSQQTELFIKNYGINGLNTLSIRGSGSGHTAIIWNNFSLQSPMNGSTDISLLPLSSHDKISIKYGGMGALYGSSAIGGSLQISSGLPFGKGFSAEAGFGYGSFNRYEGNTTLAYSNHHLSLNAKVYYCNVKNDFLFRNLSLAGEPRQRQQHAAAEQYGFMYHSAFKIKKQHHLLLNFWFQESKRQFPALMTQSISGSGQNDRFIRASAEWNFNPGIVQYKIRSALFSDMVHYKDTISGLDALSHSLSSVSEAEAIINIAPGHALNTGLHFLYAQATSENFNSMATQNELALYAAYTATAKKGTWKLNVAVRAMLFSGKMLSPVPAAGFELKLHKGLWFYTNVSRNYKTPTLNDLYWVPGGNPDLKPEDSWSEEIGLKYNFQKNILGFNISLSGFNNNMSNWIVWLPENNYWTPKNILSVWSAGSDGNIGLSLTAEKLQCSLNLNYCYSHTVATKSNITSSVGKQLLYTPRMNLNGSLSVSYKKWHLNFSTGVTSKSFTSYDNSSFLNPYSLGNIYISKTFCVQNFQIMLFMQCFNLWNTTYQTIAWQAMPGIHYKTGIHFKFHNNLKKQP